MTRNDERLEPILRKYGLTRYPDCDTPVTVQDVGWNPHADFADVFPIVYLACARCRKRLGVFQAASFAQSLDDALQALSEA
jgi:hypothetical protein